jgi:hypothetical protein
MTRKTASEINFLSINENFPVAGEDNDTQSFRDNFDTIKTSLRLASEELTDIYQNSARLDDEADFANNSVRNAIFNSCKEKVNGINVIDAAVTDTITVDYENGNYQIFKLESNAAFTFQNLPTNTTAVAKLTLEFFGDGSTRTITFIGSDGAQFRKPSTFPAPLTVNSLSERTIIEVWRHSSNFIFLNYLGNFVA